MDDRPVALGEPLIHGQMSLVVRYLPGQCH